MNRAVVLLLGLGLPCLVPTLASSATVAAGYKHTVVVNTTDGTVWAWGANGSGQLGDGTTTARETPVQVEGLAGIVAVAAGGHHTLALASDGTIWAWGDNEYGQIGDGNYGTDARLTRPVRIGAGRLTNIAPRAS